MEIAGTLQDEILHNCRAKIYPNGRIEILAAPGDCFRERGWELSDKWAPDPKNLEEKDDIPSISVEENLVRARRRARSAIHDYAFSNDFDRFVTFTLNSEKIDRYDVEIITKKLNVWLDNKVRRNGLKYILIPELHKDGAVHFHGLINSGALKEVDSGTLTNGGKPRRARSPAHRAELLAAGYNPVYNLPQWGYGYTTAIALYGAREAAVAYVTKYITKTEAKVGGRWYYSGGDLSRPEIYLYDVDFDDFRREHPDGCWSTQDGSPFCSYVIEGGKND